MMISCICPPVGEELWQILGHTDSIAYEPWPTYDVSALKDSVVNIAIQVNGKVRGNIDVAVDATEDRIKEAALNCPSLKSHLEGKNVVKVIVIKGKIVNIVVK